MNTMPVHTIEISHRWREVDRVELAGNSFETIEKCLDCSKGTRCLHLRPSYDKLSSGNMPNDELMARMRETSKGLKEAYESFGEQFLQIIADAEYSSFEELEVDIHKRYMGELDVKEMSYDQLVEWVSQRTPKFKMKTMLVQKQGLVCNKCDSIMYYLSELTIDHINGNRSDGRLTNLQLLCLRCHKDKNNNDNEATEFDVSPVRYSGETCVHLITCVEVANMRRAYNSRKEP